MKDSLEQRILYSEGRLNRIATAILKVFLIKISTKIYCLINSILHNSEVFVS
jgi:hypothetical protein